MAEIKFTMAARCEAAGRQNNEDNFQLTDNLAGDDWGFINDKEVIMSEKGALLVVCDGMGGMNAGATASDLAVKSIKEWFSNDRLTPEVIESQANIMLYIEQAITAADEKIKLTGSQNSEQEGMGSTIVLAWMIGEQVYIGWCGDSRAYRFNAATGLERLSHDHSYVQELVDSGKLSPELAFEHPDNNIITRSLGDNRQKVKPDVRCYPLQSDDIILLCSDGLCGVLRDSEIESIVANNADSTGNCRNALWTESEKTGWTDNVTIALCRIVSGIENTELMATATIKEINSPTDMKKRKPVKFIILLIVLLLLLLGIAFEIGHLIIEKSWWLPKSLFSSVTLLFFVKNPLRHT